uniref:DDE-1 domain-containing protein n=1 Tax=Ditylenchus dipsaci TaxID=166011 RepID=A0A915EKE5_9BILA
MSPYRHNLQRNGGQTVFFVPSKRLFVWDSFRCHISESTKKQLKQANLDTAVVPGGCTKFVQAPDVCWNSPFKPRFENSTTTDDAWRKRIYVWRESSSSSNGHLLTIDR